MGCNSCEKVERILIGYPNEGYTIVRVTFVRYFLGIFRFFTTEFSQKRCVKLTRTLVRNTISTYPVTAYLDLCRTGRSSAPSFRSRINFSARSRFLQAVRIFSGSSSTLDSRIKNPSRPDTQGSDLKWYPQTLMYVMRSSSGVKSRNLLMDAD